MSVLVFLDLDDTIMQTLPKCPPGERLEIAAVNRDGSPGSFMTKKQRALVDWLLATTHVIPCTGRNLSAYQRVKLPFTGQAILNHGGTIADARGEPDLGWYDRVDPALVPLGALQDAVLGHARENGLTLRARLIGDHDRTLYLSVKHPAADMAQIALCAAFLEKTIDHATQRLVSSANNLAVIPRAFSKGRAVRHLIASRGFPDEVVLGFGDTPSDLGFMAACDLSVLPQRSPLSHAMHAAVRVGAGLGDDE